MLKLKPLSQQVVVITGASSGIGLATARLAAKRGATIVVGARNEEALRNLVEEVQANGGKAAYAVCDVGVEEDVERLANVAISTFGRFDTWVNNAGISIFGEVWDVPLDAWRRMFDTTYWGQVHGARAALHHYRDRGGPGAIINIGSFFGDRAPPAQSTYSSAKFAVHGFTEAMRVEIAHGKLPVSVSLIHPGRIDTPYNEHAGNWMPMKPAHRGMIYPPKAVAEAILWCAAHPKRDMFVGSQAALAAFLGRLAPRMTDMIFRDMMYATQHSKTRTTDGDHNGALFEAGQGGKERGSHEPQWMRRRSYFVAASKHPAMTALAIGAASVAAVAIARKMSARAGPVEQANAD